MGTTRITMDESELKDRIDSAKQDVSKDILDKIEKALESQAEWDAFMLRQKGRALDLFSRIQPLF